MPLRRFPGRFLAIAGVAATFLVAAVVAVVGGLFLSPGALIAIGVVSLAVGCLTWGKVRETDPARRRVTPGEAGLMAGGATGGAVLTVTGLVVLTGGPTAAVITGVVAAAAVGVALVRSSKVRRGRPARARGAVVALPLRPVGSLPVEALGREWVLSTSVLASVTDVGTRQSIVRRRQELLDELERRDPAGFGRWLAEGRPGSDPAPFLQAPSADERGDAAAA